MKTWEEFVEEKENTRHKCLRPGEPGFNAYHVYLCFLFNENNYTFIEGPRTMTSNADLITTTNSLCDLLEKYPTLRYDLNFSDQFPKPEENFFRRLSKLVLDKERFRDNYIDAANQIASSEHLVIRAVNAGLTEDAMYGKDRYPEVDYAPLCPCSDKSKYK